MVTRPQEIILANLPGRQVSDSNGLVIVQIPKATLVLTRQDSSSPCDAAKPGGAGSRPTRGRAEDLPGATTGVDRHYSSLGTDRRFGKE
jgi:hypothetical protein